MSMWLWIFVTTLSMIGLFHAHCCLDEERTALLHLKAYFRGYHPDLFFLASWKDDQASNCCSGWEGVTCGSSKSSNGRVISLSFRGYGMTIDQVNASVFLQFRELRQLDLSFNSIKSWIDQDKGSAAQPSKLETLDLRGNGFSRSVDILPHLTGYQSLKHLLLEYNQLNEVIPLCDIEALESLEELDLSFNRIFGFKICNSSSRKTSSTPNKMKTLVLSNNTLNASALPCLNGFRSLENLQLSANNLIGGQQLHGLCLLEKLQTLDLSFTQLYEIPLCFGNLTALKVLDLSGNKLAGSLPLWLNNTTDIQKLNLSDNMYTGNIASSSLTALTSLHALDLKGNQLQVPLSFHSFANHTTLKYFICDFNEGVVDPEDKSYTSQLQLQVLSMSNCKLTSYPSVLHHQYDLQIIDLSNNPLQSEFPTWLLQNNPNLRALFLQNSSLRGSLQLPSLSNSGMVAIDISQNKIRGQILENIGDMFPQLELLYMFQNGLEGKIPPSFGHLKSLRHLELSDNNLTGSIPKNLTEGCSSLWSLRLSNNNLQGEIPSFYSLPRLFFLDLYGNKFSGRIEDTKFNSNLSVLVLGNNSFEGAIPKAICNLIELTYLDLSLNNLHMSIPTCFSNLTLLKHLHLNNNKLTGPIILPNSPLLATVDLNNNHLDGNIPMGFSNLSSLSILLLQGNSLEGEIPLQLCKLGERTVWDLSNNFLSGFIPPCIARTAFKSDPSILSTYTIDTLPDTLVQTYVLKVDGQVSLVEEQVSFMTKSMNYFYKGRGLQYLSGVDLSCNLLKGKLPQELGNLNEVQSLNISHNYFEGPIPMQFSNLKQIESLDLSYNRLNGSIPSKLTELYNLAVFRVAHNNLSGEIPFQAQFSTFNASSYEGNTFLCGPPLQKKCTTERFPYNDANGIQDVNATEDGWIDIRTFYVTFMVSGATMFTAVLTILWINPHWRRRWFYLVDKWIMLSYHFERDIL